MPHNLERHPTIGGCWIAYDAQGFAFRIFRAHPGYCAKPSHSGKTFDDRRFRADKLKDVAAMIAASSREGCTGLGHSMEA